MKNIFVFTFSCFLLFSCSKDTDSINYTQSLLSNKTWFLRFKINEKMSKSFMGKNTYFIHFSKNGTTLDSDGISGYFVIQENHSELSINIDGMTLNGVQANYKYTIEQIGLDQMTVSYQEEGIKTKKIFSTTH